MKKPLNSQKIKKIKKINDPNLPIIKNLGGRPSLISIDQTLEIVRIKGEYGILTWQKAIILIKEIHPDWKLPHYKNCMIHINRVFPKMAEMIIEKLAKNRDQILKKN